MSRPTCRAFLELLARDAAAVEYEGPLLEARAAGAPPELIAELERSKLLALRVRALLERRRRRERELAALFDTASDLAGLRDLDAVLEAIVRRARRLLDADVTYMTLQDDERGDTFMRVTDGSISARFQRLRLPPGAGLGGLVAQTAIPYVTAAYLDDERFRHTTEIDAAVREEGLVAILGVPMRLGSRTIGVLFAANRTARPFGREEIALLGSLGAHAAIAIDTARLLQETRAALEELSAANERARAHSAAVERAAEAHDRMTDVVLRGGGVEDVAAVVTDILGGALVVVDAEGRRLAASGLPDRIDDAVLADALAGGSAAAPGRTTRRGDLLISPAVAGNEVLGTLALRLSEAQDADQRILERAALVTALLLLFRRTVAEAEGRVRGELLDDLVTGRVDDDDILHDRAARLGLDLDRDHVVVVADYEGPRERAVFWARSHAAVVQGLATERHGEVVLALPGTDPGAAARQVAKELTAALGRAATAAGSGPVRGARDLKPRYEEARRCVQAMTALGRIGDGAAAAELGFVGLLLSEERDVAGFLESTIGAVCAYDARRGTALVRTLEAYFASRGSLARAAEALHVHVNTVAQRLERIGQLLGEDWQQPERALEIQLALQLQRLRENFTG